MKVSVTVDVENIFKQVPLREKLRLAHQWEQEAWATRLDKVVHRLRAIPSVRQVSAREITRIVEDVRRSRYARASRRP